MKIAFCTNSMVNVDEHFGRAATVAVYDVKDTGHEFVEKREFIPIDGSQEHKVSIEEKVAALKDCAILYLTEIGGPAAAVVVKNRIHPVKVDSGVAIDGLIDKLQDTLKGNPPPWLKKLLMENK